MNMQTTDELRIVAMKELLSPEQLINEYPLSEKASETVAAARSAMQNILHGKDDRLIVISGPCSIHDPEAAIDYAQRLLKPLQNYNDKLVVVLRGFFVKHRTTVCWR